MHKIRSFTFILLFILLYSSLSSQIKIKELPDYDITSIDSLFFDINSTRTIIPLKKGWTVRTPGSDQKSVKVSVPSTFDGESTLVYEKEVFFSVDQIKYKNYQLEFLGVNYRADVLLNGMVIHKHPGGSQPFDVELPTDLLRPNTENQITVNVHFDIDDISTIPSLQRFLFPVLKGGIFRDVYLRETEKIFISNYDIDYSLSENYGNAAFSISAKILNRWGIVKEDSLNYDYRLRCIVSNEENSFTNFTELPNLRKTEITDTDISFDIDNPNLLSESDNNSYRIELALLLNDTLVDLTSTKISIYDISVGSDELLLNKSPFEIKGTTYFYSENESGGLITYDKLVSDLQLIKESGFNTIRFSKNLPHPFTLHAMEDIGLFALIELPLNSIPDAIAAQNDFFNRVNNQLALMEKGYEGYSNILAYGLGGGYIGTSDEQFSFLANLSEILKQRIDRPIYSSFISLPEKKIDSIDLYGIELFSIKENKLSKITEEIQSKKYSTFISEATYPSFLGNSNGYLNRNSNEAAAKYYSDIIDYSNENGLNGFIISSFYDYYGDFKSFYAGYNSSNKYEIGLLPNAEQIDRISYKVVRAKLTDANKITIPIGTAKDDSPILFVLIGLGLSIFMALLINSKRKFREDAGRALIRPYNFFADIRDHRILSGFQTNILMLILAGSFSLLLINLLYFLRTNILLEKILLAFGSPKLIDYIIYIAWHPLNGFVILFIFSIFLLLLTCVVFKVFSFFLKNRVFFSSIYYSVIWALLPLALLLPLELVLYRVLIANVINLYLYIFIGVYVIWLLQRMIKGIYVIFDVRPVSVYLYGFIFSLVVFGGILLIYQLTNSTVYHIIRAFAEYKFL